MSDENAIEQGKLHVAELVRNAAKEQNIELTGWRWFSPTPATKWEAEVKASNGRTAYRDFTPKQLTECKTDNQMKMQVHQKVVSIILQLTPK